MAILLLASLSLSLVTRALTQELFHPVVVNSTGLSPGFPASSVVALEEDRRDGEGRGNFWLAGRGAGQGFVLSLGCRVEVVGLVVRNSHNSGYKNRGTRRFLVWGGPGSGGPGAREPGAEDWVLLLEGELEDPRPLLQPPIVNFTLPRPIAVTHIMFEVVDHWGAGAALQHFAVIGEAKGGQANSSSFIWCFRQFRAEPGLHADVFLLDPCGGNGGGSDGSGGG